MDDQGQGCEISEGSVQADLTLRTVRARSLQAGPQSHPVSWFPNELHVHLLGNWLRNRTSESGAEPRNLKDGTPRHSQERGSERRGDTAS